MLVSKSMLRNGTNVLTSGEMASSGFQDSAACIDHSRGSNSVVRFATREQVVRGIAETAITNCGRQSHLQCG